MDRFGSIRHQNYVFLEDQYFVYQTEIQAALVAAMAARASLRLIVLTQVSEGAVGYSGYSSWFIRPILTRHVILKPKSRRARSDTAVTHRG